MSEKPKIIKRENRPLDPDLRRLVKAMQAVLRRRYADPFERQIAAQKIMREMAA